MSIKDKIAALLFGSGGAEAQEEETRPEQEQVAESAPEILTAAVDPALVELPAEHAIFRILEQARRESQHLPTPRISLDEEGVVPAEVVAREKKRVQTLLSSACNARMKKINAKAKTQAKKKKGEEEKKKDDGPPPLDAAPFFFFSTDKLWAWVMIFPPVRQGEELSHEMLESALDKENITFGVNERLVEHLPRDERRYLTLYLIAKGTPAFDGENGNIVEHFPRVVERMLEVDEYDQVDYTALNLIHNVKEGQEICKLIEPTEGEPGRTVTDQEIPAKSGKSGPLPMGRNTEISEDGISLLASMAGHVEFTGHSFQVKPVLDIPGNVDFSTGDINFLGDVNIKGDVLSGFTVRSAGNIQVGGVVEAGSTVEAGGDLVVARGILGDGTTVVQGGVSIFAKYIENSTIYAREVLQTDCIVNGNVYCDGEVQVNSGRGSIMGGRVWAAKLINARAVGSQSECRTSITLGGMPCTNFEREILKQQMKTLEMELERLECQIDSPTKSSLLSKTRMKLSVAGLKLRQLDEEQPAVQLPTENRDKGRMECGIVYPGTEISIGDEVLRLRRISRQCVVTLINDEIVVM